MLAQWALLLSLLNRESMSSTSSTASGADTNAPDAMSATTYRIYGRDKDRHARKIEFLDGNGVITRAIVVDGTQAQALLVSERNDFVGAFESLPANGALTSPVEFRYYNARGALLFAAPICCDLGRDYFSRGYVSEDGSTVGLLDAPVGSECPDPNSEGSIRAPAGCKGLRVFSGSGHLLYSDVIGGGPVILSPMGTWLLYSTPDELVLRNLGSRHQIRVPRGRSGIRFVKSVDEQGIVSEPTIRGKRRRYSEARGVFDE